MPPSSAWNGKQAMTCLVMPRHRDGLVCNYFLSLHARLLHI